MKKNLGICIIAILVICSLTITSLATNVITELQDKHNQISNQINETSTDLENVQTELSALMQELQSINEKIVEFEDQIEQLNGQTEDLVKKIEKLEISLKASEETYSRQKKLLEERLLTLYEAGETSYLDVLLTSRNISDFVSNYYLISEITKYDMELLEDIEREKNSIETNKKLLESQKETLKIIRNNRERVAIVLENTKVIRNNYMNKLTKEERELQEKIDEYEKQVRQIEAEIILITTANLDSEYTGGIMAWPTPGYTRITSRFGMRVHPIDGLYKLHTGVDIAAPIGANFIAVSDGVVIKAEYSGAYGNMVIIDHGGGISTLYAHGSEIVVTLGQTVRRGEPVLKVGSTGYSTGPHAHFEVRVKGVCVDPLNYIMKVEN
jgi:murein DD-endopeptidase MepM/ murein hydrolase activator NlpD